MNTSTDYPRNTLFLSTIYRHAGMWCFLSVKSFVAMLEPPQYALRYLQPITVLPISYDVFPTNIHEPNFIENNSSDQSFQTSGNTGMPAQIYINDETSRNISVQRSDQACPSGFRDFYDSAFTTGSLTSRYSIRTSSYIDFKCRIFYYEVNITASDWDSLWYGHS